MLRRHFIVSAAVLVGLFEFASACDRTGNETSATEKIPSQEQTKEKKTKQTKSAPGNGTAQPSSWTRLLGASGDDGPNDAANSLATTGDGAVYAVGDTEGNLGGQSYAGGRSDGFVAKYNKSGKRKWVRLRGGPGAEEARSVTVDKEGAVYVAGVRKPSYPVKNYDGNPGATVAKYDSAGNQQWERVLGTSTASASAVAVHEDGSLYVAGSAGNELAGQAHSGKSDAFVSAYDSTGNRKWMRFLGTPDADEAHSVAVNRDGSIYVTGEINGDLADAGITNLGLEDSFLAKYDSAGNREWVELQKTSKKDTGKSVAVDTDGGVYVAGVSVGDLGGQTNKGGRGDLFVVKYDSAGNQKWVRLMGTSGLEMVTAAALDGKGAVYVAGETLGSLGGESNSGSRDAFVVTYGGSGERESVRLLGTSNYDRSNAVAANAGGPLYVGGRTHGELGGQSPNGGFDAFVSRMK